MKIYFMLAYARKTTPAKPLLADVIAKLEARGFDVVTGFAESLVIQPESMRVEADLYILKSHSALWLSLAAVLDTQRARILNPYASCVTAVNKIRASHRLATAGVPIPRSWVTGNLARVADVPHAMPLVLKPSVGRGGIGIRMVQERAELATSQVDDGMLIQEHIASIEDEVKLYVVGEDVFGARKHRDSGEREPCEVDANLAAIARRCGSSLGLGVYGVDVIRGANGPVIVDVNYFPSFRGVPKAADVLADYIARYARDEVRALELPS